MCEPISMIMMALGAGAGLLGMAGQKKPPTPPPAELPAPPAPTAREPNAIVRVGQADDPKNTQSNSPDPGDGFMETRKAGTAIGGLGRSGLAL